MKAITRITLAGAVAFAFGTAAFAQEFTSGTVKKLDEKAKKVTLLKKFMLHLPA